MSYVLTRFIASIIKFQKEANKKRVCTRFYAILNWLKFLGIIKTRFNTFYCVSKKLEIKNKTKISEKNLKTETRKLASFKNFKFFQILVRKKTRFYTILCVSIRIKFTKKKQKK
jgi:hypothetical protein